MGLLDDIRGLLTPKPAVVPNPFDRQANAAIPIMGASEILPNMVGRMTGSPIAEFAAGFLSPSSWIKQPNKMKIFAGKGAKTADIPKLEKAQDMAKAGSPREAIWKETGWWQGPDKQWRFEIADDAAKQLKNAKDTGMHYLDQWISHPELQGAYPKMFNHEFAGIAGDGGILAMAKDKYGHGGSFTQNNLIVDGATKGAERKSTTLHELQHAIQQREGWARGGSPDAMRSFLAPDPSLQSAYSQAELYDAYHRLAGEAEARLTQARMPMTMDERLTTPPWTMFDVPESQQIVRFGDGPAMSTGRPRNHLGQEIPPTPYELAHAEAQRVAALPVEQGGLGLPEGNTAMDRARAMGMDIAAYRGAAADNMTGNYETMWSGGNSDIANAYIDEVHGFENGVVMPLKVSNKIPTYDMRKVDPYDLKPDEFGNPQAIGKYLNSDDMPSGTQGSVINAPRNLYRSRFAAFNPAKRDSADLLAGIAPWAMPIGATLLGGSFLLPPEEY